MSTSPTTLPFEELAEAIKGRRSDLRPYQRAPARPLRARRGLVEPALPSRLRRRHRDRRAAWRRRHRDAGRELRHGGAACARRHERDRNPRPAHRLPEAGDAGPRHQGAFGLLPHHPLDRLRALHRLSGVRGRSGRDRDRLLHDRRQPHQHARGAQDAIRAASRRWRRRTIRTARSPTARSRAASAFASTTTAR